ncbi:MAG: 1-phosphofructokinase family hexose kinase, partial [Streptosporangiaceae bacterium]
HETRIAILHDRRAATTTVVNEPGPAFSPHDWTVMTDFVNSHLHGVSALVCTGSLLPGVPDDGYVDLIHSSRQAAVPVIIDASGAALMRCAEAQPEIIKVNLEEAESAVALTAKHDESAKTDLMSRARHAANRLHGMSGNAVIVTVSIGAVLVERGRTVIMPAPSVTVRNEVGAGDSFLAGLAAGLIEHGDLLVACRRAVAVASASVEAPQPGWLDVAYADELEQLVVPEVFR